jgi:uncharacterized protein
MEMAERKRKRKTIWTPEGSDLTYVSEDVAPPPGDPIASHPYYVGVGTQGQAGNYMKQPSLPMLCTNCNGTGTDNTGSTCPRCSGSGYVKEDNMKDHWFQMLGDTEPELYTNVLAYDAVELDDEAKVRFTEDGYLVANPRIARTGIQIYKGSECGKPKLDTVRVYRPEGAVFSDAAIHTYTHLPVTLGHPKQMVTAANWKEFAVGDTGDEVLRDGKTVRVPMMVRDEKAIKEYKDGRNQLSVGYMCDIEWSPGITEDGEEYDAIQQNIRANHLAIVSAARGGSSLRIGDNSNKEVLMNLKRVTIDGVECEMTDTAASLVQRTIQRLTDQTENFAKKKKEKEEECDSIQESSQAEITKRDEALKVKDAEITTLKAALADATDPAKQDLRIKDRQRVVDRAKAVFPAVVSDGKSIADIQRQVVVAKVGDVAKDWNDAQLSASFDTIAVGAAARGTVADAVQVFSKPHFAATVADEREKAYADSEFHDANAWRGDEWLKANKRNQA